MLTRIQNGETLDHVASGAKTSGEVIVIGVRIAVAQDAIASGATGAVSVSGVHQLAKKSGDTMAQGAIVYWDATNLYMTTTSTSNTLAGYAAEAAASSDVTMKVKINA